jgi:hypothetical protein
MDDNINIFIIIIIVSVLIAILTPSKNSAPFPSMVVIMRSKL